MPLHSISFVIPAYNEESRIKPTLESLHAFTQSHFPEAEILVINDGSRDRTVGAVESMMPKIPGLRVLSLPKNMGKGSAIRAGFTAATKEWVLVADADGSTDWEGLLNFQKHLDSDRRCKAVYGSRNTAFASVEGRGPIRYLGAWVLNKIICLLTGLDFRDTQCGFKLLTTPLAREFTHYGRQDRFAWDIELLVFLKDRGHSVAELPVRWVHRDGSKLRPFRDGARLIRETIQIARDPRRPKGG